MPIEVDELVVIVDRVALLTVTVINEEVLVFPTKSVATALIVCDPFNVPTVPHEYEYGDDVPTGPRFVFPSSLKRTEATPTLSEDVTVNVVVPTIVAPPLGAVTVTVGAIVSASIATVVVAPLSGSEMSSVPVAVPAANVIEEDVADKIV